MECKRLPTDYEIRDFTLKIILLNQKFWFDNFPRTPKNLPLGAGYELQKANYFDQYDSLFNQRTNLS